MRLGLTTQAIVSGGSTAERFCERAIGRVSRPISSRLRQKSAFTVKSNGATRLLIRRSDSPSSSSASWSSSNPAIIELFPDNLPHAHEKKQEFARFLQWCHNGKRFAHQSPFRVVEVGDVESRNHVILQCVDLIIGAVGYKLNKEYKAAPRSRRSKTAHAKIPLYERIRHSLGRIDMNERGTRAFSIGVSTGQELDRADRWRHKFRQWDFRRPGVTNPDWEVN